MGLAGAEPKQILMVDPEAGPDSSVCRLLANNNYRVDWADSAGSAWAAIVEDPPDLVLLETMLPNGTEGFHLVWRLRDHPDSRFNSLPIMIVSRIHQTTNLNLFPDFHDGHYEAADFLPVQAFIDKPVDHEVLLKKVSSALAATRVPAENPRGRSMPGDF